MTYPHDSSPTTLSRAGNSAQAVQAHARGAALLLLLLLGVLGCRSAPSESPPLPWWVAPVLVPEAQALAPGATVPLDTGGVATFAPAVSGRQVRFATRHTYVTLAFDDHGSALAALPPAERTRAITSFVARIGSTLEAEWTRFARALAAPPAPTERVPVFITETRRRGKLAQGAVHVAFAGAGIDLEHELRHAMLGPAVPWLAEGIATGGLGSAAADAGHASGAVLAALRRLTRWSFARPGWDRDPRRGPPSPTDVIATKVFYARAADLVRFLRGRWGAAAVTRSARQSVNAQTGAPRPELLWSLPEPLAPVINAWRVRAGSSGKPVDDLDDSNDDDDFRDLDAWAAWVTDGTLPADEASWWTAPFLEPANARLAAGDWRHFAPSPHPLVADARQALRLVFEPQAPASGRGGARSPADAGSSEGGRDARPPSGEGGRDARPPRTPVGVPATVAVALRALVAGEVAGAQRARETLVAWQRAASTRGARAWRRGVTQAAFVRHFRQRGEPTQALDAWCGLVTDARLPFSLRLLAYRQWRATFAAAASLPRPARRNHAQITGEP